MNRQIRKSILEKLNEGITVMEQWNAGQRENVQRGGVQHMLPLTYAELLELKKMLRG